MHCYVDASKKAFAAALYVDHSDDQVHSKLIATKSMVSISIPTLELCKAIVSSRLATYVLKKSERASTALPGAK